MSNNQENRIEETRTCQNKGISKYCSGEFVIDPEDFVFYEKIKVPPPTFCPECRMIHGMTWRNCRSLYRRNCDACDKVVISMYSKEPTPKVYCMDCWNSDNRNPLKQGMDVDFSMHFFEQFNLLRKNSPILFAHHTGVNINSEYTNYIANDKNVYLCYSAIDCEDCMYSENIDKSKNSFDNFTVSKLDQCFENIDSVGNFNSNFLIKSENCIDSSFLYDCVNSSNCFMSSNLRNQSYYFYNQKLNKEEYLKKIEELEMNKYSNLEKLKNDFKDLISNKAINKYAQILSSENVTGDYISNSKNIQNSFNVKDSENIKHSYRVLMSAKDSYDNIGLAQGELIYSSIATSFGTYKNNFTYLCVGSKECEYSMMCKNSSNCFGCVGLVNAKYCILNKQYSKEEYFEMVEQIKKHMNEMLYFDSKNRIFKYGEFFPYEFCPFGYNETNAHDFYPINKEEAIHSGYLWFDRLDRNYNITLNSNDLADDILNVDDSILNQVISCAGNGNQLTQCAAAFRIVREELAFYRNKKLPLPRYCPNCRHYERLSKRNPLKLWHRSCMKEGCTNEFETSYAPDRPEIVYCEKCYQQEVY
jgi:hypothetical protein